MLTWHRRQNKSPGESTKFAQQIALKDDQNIKLVRTHTQIHFQHRNRQFAINYATTQMKSRKAINCKFRQSADLVGSKLYDLSRPHRQLRNERVVATNSSFGFDFTQRLVRSFWCTRLLTIIDKLVLFRTAFHI